MTTQNQAQPPAGAPAQPAAQQPPAQAQPAPGEEYKAMSPDAFKGRLAEERNAGVVAFLKSAGFEKPEQLTAALTEYKALKQSGMSDADKLNARIKELEAQAALAQRTPKLEETIRRTLEAEEAAIPASRKGLLALAPVEPELRLPWLSAAKAQGLFTETPQAPAQPAAQPGLTNTKAGTAPPAAIPGATNVKHPRDMTDAEFAAFERAWKSQQK